MCFDVYLKFTAINRITVELFWKILTLKETAFSALTLLVGRQKGHRVRKKTEQWGAGMVICLERGAYLHMVQLMPLTVSCFSKIQIGFTFLVPAHLGSPGQRAIKQVCVCVSHSQQSNIQH